MFSSRRSLFCIGNCGWMAQRDRHLPSTHRHISIQTQAQFNSSLSCALLEIFISCKKCGSFSRNAKMSSNACSSISGFVTPSEARSVFASSIRLFMSRACGFVYRLCVYTCPHKQISVARDCACIFCMLSGTLGCPVGPLRSDGQEHGR